MSCHYPPTREGLHPVSKKTHPTNTKPTSAEAPSARGSKNVIVLIVVAIFLGFVVMKLALGNSPTAPTPVPGAATAGCRV